MNELGDDNNCKDDKIRNLVNKFFGGDTGNTGNIKKKFSY